MKSTSAVVQHLSTGQREFGPIRIAACVLLAAVLGTALPATAVEQVLIPVTHDEVEIGRRIYVDGILPSGAALKGMRHGIRWSQAPRLLA